MEALPRQHRRWDTFPCFDFILGLSQSRDGRYSRCIVDGSASIDRTQIVSSTVAARPGASPRGLTTGQPGHRRQPTPTTDGGRWNQSHSRGPAPARHARRTPIRLVRVCNKVGTGVALPVPTLNPRSRREKRPTGQARTPPGRPCSLSAPRPAPDDRRRPSHLHLPIPAASARPSRLAVRPTRRPERRMPVLGALPAVGVARTLRRNTMSILTRRRLLHRAALSATAGLAPVGAAPAGRKRRRDGRLRHPAGRDTRPPAHRPGHPALPARLRLGRGHLGLPDRGRGQGGRSRRVDLGHLQPHARAGPATATPATWPPTTTTASPTTWT